MNHLSYDREDTPNAAPGCKPTFLTWNLFRCAFGHEGGKPSFLTGIFFNVYPTSSGTSSPPYLECVSGRERGQALLPDLLMFFNVQPGGGKPTFLTWNLLPCATDARRGQAHLPYVECSSMCNRRKAGASPPSLPGIFFVVYLAGSGQACAVDPGFATATCVYHLRTYR